MAHIVLYEHKPTRSARVRWALLEAGLAFNSVGGSADILHSEPLRKLHPLGKLPAVLIDGRPLFESAAIVNAVCDLAPETGLLARPGSPERNLHYQWTYFALTEMEPYLHSTEINTSQFVLPKDQHVPQIKPQNEMMYRRAAGVLNDALQDTDYLVGDRFSAADIIVGYTVAWGNIEGLHGPYPNLAAYFTRLRAREHCTLLSPEEYQPEG